MALEEYRRKRDFHSTPEPAPHAIKASKQRLGYLIQKHDATRLHYDFRLELDGVLLSWAVTKGPSLDPADKRLAVKVEDHPIDYGTFEGTIPKGQYGGGTVMVWDTGTWEPAGDAHAALKKGHLSFTLHGNRLKGKWDLIRMRGDGKRENWLLVKEADDEARRGANEQFLEELSFSVKTGRSMDEIAGGEAKSRPKKTSMKTAEQLDGLVRKYPEVQLATLVDQPPEGSQWVHELKFDGYRLLGFVAAGDARLQTRNGKDWTAKFPSLTEALVKLRVKDAVLDMEAVVLDADGRSNFQKLQAALGDAGDASRIVAFVFDLLHLDGKDLSKLPLIDRKAKLQEVLGDSKRGSLRFSEHIIGSGAEVFAKAREKGLEGIISKSANGSYSPGRQKDWLKTKCIQRQEFIILGFSAARTGDRALGALYIGYREGGDLRYAGKVGTGFTMARARDLAARFGKLAIDKATLTRAETAGVPTGEYRGIQWIKPVLLCEVAFTEWTSDGRIRHPSFQGLREDKDAAGVKKEMPVPTPAPKANASKSKATSLVLEGITITHPDRVISETGHITKGALAEYHAAIAPLMVPRIAMRPLSLLRCPEGIDGDCFYQRSPGRGLGKDVHPYEFNHKGKKYEYLYIEDAKGLIEVIQMGAIEIHPWGATIAAIDHPDRLVFDLDPDSDVPIEALKLAAEDLHIRLKRKGLESVLKCTGGKGLHVTVPLAAKDEWAAVKSFAAAMAEEMVEAAPEAYVATMSKAKRKGKIFIDYFRNDYTATSIADYSVRARPGAPVAVPLEWKELKHLKSASQFTIADVVKRLKGKTEDAFSRLEAQTLPKQVLAEA